MKNGENITEETLKELLSKLKLRGFEQQGISTRIGLDDKGQTLSDAVRGKQKKRIKEIYEKIVSEFVDELEVKDIPIGVITLKTLNDKLDLLLRGQEELKEILKKINR